MPKAYFFDLDGTLLDKKISGGWDISQTNLDAVRKLSEFGNLVIVSTGRPTGGFLEERKYMKAKYMIAGNGAFIFDASNNLLDYNPMNLEASKKLIHYLKEKQIFAKVNNKGIIYRSNKISAKIMSKIFSLVTNKFGSAPWSEFVEPEKFEKIVLFETHNKALDLVKFIKNEYDEYFEITIAGHGYMIEITDKKASKGQASLKILEWEKINPQDATHFGDTMNDASAMKVLGPSFTFQNADKDLIPYATYIGPSHKNGGVAKIINGEYKKNDLNKKMN